ncbi:hypothetical protein [Uliginosibacterium sp. 31-12]|uniref:hypothetical protein n=1 Tax=Uliginosibacterium sp. 31-12 TaxID=3062781 RepID=UPI0026E21BBE|nr:hypothetical protein [Uliginosibacterium sp. 31-12]MDO6385632.1 hypothetical protein [Uliginosibacterium sp. 31-12]
MDVVREELLQEIENIVNLFAGMQFDPSIPKHVKEALSVKAAALESVLDRYIK